MDYQIPFLLRCNALIGYFSQQRSVVSEFLLFGVGQFHVSIEYVEYDLTNGKDKVIPAILYHTSALPWSCILQLSQHVPIPSNQR